MRDYVCDLCRKKITPSDIRMELKIEVDGKREDSVDMHAKCYYLFMRELRSQFKSKDEYTVAEPTVSLKGE